MNDEYEYTTEELNEMANRLDLYSIVCQHQPCVKRQGRNFFFHCNNNRDSDASLLVDREHNFFKCFSDNTGGNALSYFVEELGYTFSEAAQEVIRLSGGGIERAKGRPDCLKVINRYRRLVTPQTNNSLGKRVYGDYTRDYDLKYQKQLPQEWLNEGISAQVMREFDIRIDRFSDRIVYPLYDKDDRFITAKGRTRLKDYKKLGIPKYISFSPLGGVDFFVGLNVTRPEVLQHNEIIIFEGIKSVMKAKDYGFGWSCAAETSHVNSDQVKLLLSMKIKNVIIAFDKDKTFQQAISGLDLLRRFTNCYVIIDRQNLLGEKESPVDRGKEVFERLYENRVRI